MHIAPGPGQLGFYSQTPLLISGSFSPSSSPEISYFIQPTMALVYLVMFMLEYLLKTNNFYHLSFLPLPDLVHGSSWLTCRTHVCPWQWCGNYSGSCITDIKTNVILMLLSQPRNASSCSKVKSNSYVNYLLFYVVGKPEVHMSKGMLWSMLSETSGNVYSSGHQKFSWLLKKYWEKTLLKS